LPTRAEAEITWLFRSSGAQVGSLAGAIQAAPLPSGRPYVWIAGEAGMVRVVRRHLVDERGVDRSDVTFAGYWRRGADQEQLRVEAAAEQVG